MFSWLMILESLATMLPAIGKAVETLHPDNATEALKINTGVALVTGMTTTLQALAATQPSTTAVGSPIGVPAAVSATPAA